MSNSLENCIFSKREIKKAILSLPENMKNWLNGILYYRSEERRVGKECRSRWRPDFSSRRRHTRCSRDWSSDVCSSDLKIQPRINPETERFFQLSVLSPQYKNVKQLGELYILEKRNQKSDLELAREYEKLVERDPLL